MSHTLSSFISIISNAEEVEKREEEGKPVEHIAESHETERQPKRRGRPRKNTSTTQIVPADDENSPYEPPSKRSKKRQ